MLRFAAGAGALLGVLAIRASRRSLSSVASLAPPPSRFHDMSVHDCGSLYVWLALVRLPLTVVLAVSLRDSPHVQVARHVYQPARA